MARAVIIDRGWMQIKTQYRNLRGMGVKVGIRSTAGSRDGVRIVDYAVWNEFGTNDGHVPSRPFMRRTADESRRYLPGFTFNLVNQVVRGRLSAFQALDRLGLMYQGRIRNTILSSPSWAVPNAPATIAAKGSSVPLVDTGAMVGAVDYEKVKL